MISGAKFSASTTCGGGYHSEGNLFPPGTPKTRRRFIMACRPFRIVDPQTGWLLWAKRTAQPLGARHTVGQTNIR